MNENAKKYDLALLKYLKNQPSKTTGEINYGRDMEAAQRIREFFIRTNLKEIARRSFDKEKFRFGVRIDKQQMDFTAYTSIQFEMALNYRVQMRASRDGTTLFLLCADYIPTFRRRDIDLFVSSWFSFDTLLMYLLTGCCAVYCILAIFLALDHSHYFFDHVFFTGLFITMVAGFFYLLRWWLARNYMDTFEMLYLLDSEGQQIKHDDPADTENKV
jgi:hypothetical protein